jgi:hypothetical protein
MKKIVHPFAGALALLIIASFWISTVVVEIFGSEATVIAVKTSIPWGFLILIPALAVTGGTGIAMVQRARGGLVGQKFRRMPIIAANGILILMPSALYLSHKASAGAFDGIFYGVQALELLGGAVNLSLIAMNMRDGLRLSGRIEKRASR